MRVLKAKITGCAGATWERNERLSTAWRSPSDPSSSKRNSLPSLTAWTDPEDPEQVGAALLAEVASLDEVRRVLEKASNELENGDGDRGYDLAEDLALNGQLEPGLLVPQEYRTVATADTDSRRCWAWVAARGNNRTRARQLLWGLTSGEVVTGVPMSKIGRGAKDISTNPAFWLKLLTEKLNKEFDEAKRRENFTASAYRAHLVAVVETYLVLGTPTPERLYQIVQTSNRREHVHPPLKFKPNDRARALGRSIIGEYVKGGLIDQVTADVLTGDLPITDLPGVQADAPVSVLRDLRSMRILTEFFPGELEKEKRLALRTALSEPPPSQLSRENINQRLRAWSALTSMSYPEPWNPRVADVLPVGIGNKGVRLSDKPLAMLLAEADTNTAAFEELLLYRAPHWLAAFDIVEADRGSMGAQKVRDEAKLDDDSEDRALRVRRSVNNSLKAMRQDKPRAVGLLREIAAAMDEGRAPRKVDDTGTPAETTAEDESTPSADRDWFNTVFPKIPSSRGRIVLEAAPNPGTEAPPPESATEAVERLLADLGTVIENLNEDAKLIPELVTQLRDHAAEASIGRPLSEATATRLVMNLVTTITNLRKGPDLIMSLSTDVA